MQSCRWRLWWHAVIQYALRACADVLDLDIPALDAFQGGTVWNSNASFVFGQSAAFTGVNEHLGKEMRRGIIAAFEQENQLYAERMPGQSPLLGLISYNDIYTGSLAKSNTERLIYEDKVFALIGEVGTPTSAQAYPVAVAAEVSFIGAFTGASFLRSRSDFKREIVNYRASYIDETASMVRYFCDILHFGRISIFYQNDSFGFAGLEGVELSLRSRQRQIHSSATYEKSNGDVMPGLLKMMEKEQPDAVVMIGSSTALSNFTILSKKYWTGVYYSTVSFVGARDFASRLQNSSNRERVFVTQVVPLPWESSIPIVADYLQAMEDLLGPSPWDIDFASLEGYIVGKFAAKVMDQLIGDDFQPSSIAEEHAALQKISKTQFLDEVYHSGIITIDGFRLGPFGANCSQLGSGCFCNQGQHEVYGTQILADGNFAELPDLNFQFQSCGYDPGEAVKLVFGQSAALEGPSKELGIGMRDGIQAAFLDAQASGILGFRELSLISYDDHYNADLAEQNAKKLIEEDNVFALIGAVGTPTSVREVPIALANNVPFIGAFTGAESLRDPFQELVINVRASYTDECVAMVKYFKEEKGITMISIFIQDGPYGDTGLSSLNKTMLAYGLEIASLGRHAVDSPQIDQEIHEALVNISNGAGMAPQAVVMFGTYVNLAKFVKAARNSSGDFNWAETYFSTVSFVGSEPFSKQLGADYDFNYRKRILVTQVVPVPTDVSEPLVEEYTTILKKYVPDASISFISLEGYVVGKFVVKVLMELAADSRSNLVNQVYFAERFEIAHRFSLDAFRIDEQANSGCNQGMNAVWLTEMLPNGTFAYKTPNEKYTLGDSCGHSKVPCELGYYRFRPDEICIWCPPGYEITANKTACVPCKAGTRGLLETRQCVICTEGKFSSAEKSTMCRYCQAGRYSDVKSAIACEKCSVGKSRGLAGPYTECNHCHPGRYSHIEGLTECRECEQGTFQNASRATQCISCETVLKNGITPTRGKTEGMNCICPKGFYYAADVDQCRNCSLGLSCAGDTEYRGDNPPAIQEQYMIIPIEKEIKLLGSDEMRPNVPADLYVYKCPESDHACPGTANWTDLMSFKTLCDGERVGIACGKCPSHYTRDGDSCKKCKESKTIAFAIYFASAPFVALWLYFTINHDNKDVEKTAEEAEEKAKEGDDQPVETPPDNPNQISESPSNKSDQPVETTSTTNSKISSKISGWRTKSVHTWKSSPSHHASMKHTSRALSRRCTSWLLCRCSFLQSALEYFLLLKEQALMTMSDLLKLLLQFFQTLGLVSPLYPPNDRTILHHNEKFNEAASKMFDFILEHLEVDCMLGSGFLARFITAQALPLVWAAIFFLNLFVSKYCCLFCKRRAQEDKEGCKGKCAKRVWGFRVTYDLTINALGEQTTAFFIGITELSVNMFVTYPHPDLKEASVIKFPAVLTSSSVYKAMVPVAIFSLLVYCGGMIAWCSYICYIAPRRASDPRFLSRYDFLLSGWHPAVWWWGVVVLIQGLASNLCVALMETPEMISIAIILLFALYLTLSVMLTPYENAVLNICNDATSLAVCVVVPAMALRGREKVSISVNSVAWIEFVAMCAPLLVGIICLFVPVPMFFQKKRRAARNAYDAQCMHDLCLMISRMSHYELNEVMAGMIDLDMHTIRTAMRIIAADLCHLQSNTHFFEKRTIRHAKSPKVFNDYHLLNMIEKEVADNKKSDFQSIHDRALVGWFLDQVADGKNAREMETVEKRNNDFAQKKVQLFECSMLRKMQRMAENGLTPGLMLHQPKPAADEIKDLWKFLDKDGNGELSREEFIQAGWEITPLCTKDDMRECFRVFDADGTGCVNEEKFSLMLLGMVYGGIHSSGHANEGETSILQRLSMKASGGEQTMDRRGRTAKFLNSIVHMQRHFRARRGETLKPTLLAQDMEANRTEGNKGDCPFVPLVATEAAVEVDMIALDNEERSTDLCCNPERPC